MANSPIILSLPIAGGFGWGQCGGYITRAMLPKRDTYLFNPGLNFNRIPNPQIRQIARKAWLNPKNPGSLFDLEKIAFDWPMLKFIRDISMTPGITTLRGSKTIGYTFFESNQLEQQWIDRGNNCYDIVATGSSWCADILSEHGVKNTATVIQGVDQSLFNGNNHQKNLTSDKFVFFSGGKFEYRKGQDIVLAAFHILAQKYSDIHLVAAWFNMWPSTMATMSRSTMINYLPSEEDYLTQMKLLCKQNNVDQSMVTFLGQTPHVNFPQIYKNSDVGLFPNRCEGGTNLVMMEYMACAKPVIASNLTGHCDVLDKNHALLIEKTLPKTQNQIFETPDLEETVELMDYAYNNRDQIGELGNRAGKYMKNITWEKNS